MPRVSAIVPCYNTAKYLPIALDSIVAQTYPDWEIVLVNDGGSDETPEIAARYRARLGERLQYIYQENRGLAGARNTAIRAARGEFYALLDADDTWLPRRLELGVAKLDANPELGMAHGGIALMDAEGKVFEYPRQDPRLVSGRIAKHIYARRVHLPGNTVLVRRSALDKVGLFDESLRSTEDRDLWFRLALEYKIGYIDEILGYYRRHPGTLTTNSGKMRATQERFAYKHYHSGHCTRAQLRGCLASLDWAEAEQYAMAGRAAAAAGQLARACLRAPWELETLRRTPRILAMAARAKLRSRREEPA